MVRRLPRKVLALRRKDTARLPALRRKVSARPRALRSKDTVRPPAFRRRTRSRPPLPINRPPLTNRLRRLSLLRPRQAE